MNLLYWNIHNNNIESFICDIIKEKKIDIFIVSEYKGLDFDLILKTLNDEYSKQPSYACEKVKIIYRKDIDLVLLREQHRYIVSKITTNSGQYLLTGVHLPDQQNNNSDDRKHEIRKIVADIIEEEKKLYGQKMQKSIVIGDMNASPFDSELINKDSFNAVLFKKLIDKTATITYRYETYERFYNPMLDYIREDDESYGSFYYGSGIGTLYWYCYDQILVRKALINKLKKIQFLKKIKDTKLLKAVMPNKEISDHLPLFVEIDL
jgi:exonuclease III